MLFNLFLMRHMTWFYDSLLIVILLDSGKFKTALGKNMIFVGVL